MRPKQTIKGRLTKSRPDGKRRAEVTKKEMAVGQQRRGDRGANGHRPEWGVTISMTGSCRRLDFRCWLGARSRYKGRGRRSGRDLEPCLQIHHVEAVGQERKCGGDGRGGRQPTEVWNVHGGPWCSLSASVLQCIANWWGRGIRGSPSTSSRLKPNVVLTPPMLFFGLIKEPEPAREFHHSHVFLAAGPQATSPEPADIILSLVDPPRDG